MGRAWSTREPSAAWTLVAPNAGMNLATGSVRRNRPSSNSIIRAVLTIGLVIE